MMETELDRAKAALDQARTDHARAVLARQEAPRDPEAARRLQQAVQEGRRAWKGYQTAATAGIAAQIEEIVPQPFRD